MAIKDSTDKLTHFAHADPGLIADLDFVLRRKQIRHRFAADSAASDIRTEFITDLDRDITFVSASLVPDGAATADGTNFATITLSVGDGAGALVKSPGAIDTDSGNDNYSPAVGVTQQITEVDRADFAVAGQTLFLQIAKAGTGVQLPAGVLVIEYELT